jgi:BlaR1 peptidase M56
MGALAALADLGRELATWMFWMSLWTLALFAAARIADLATRRIVAARLRILYYLAVPLRLLFPVAWSAPLAVGDVAVLGRAVGLSMTSAPGQAPPVRALADGGAFDAFVLVPPVHLLFAAILGIIWWRAHRRVTAEVREGTIGPAVVGILRPRMVLPRTGLDVDGLERVVGHERAHLARRDPLVSALMRLICLILWPILPLAIAARRVRMLMEIACDDCALRDATSVERKAYMRTLYSLSLAGAPTPAPAFGAGRGLAARLREASRPVRAPMGLQIAIAFLLPGVLLGCAGLGTSPSGSDDLVGYLEIVPCLTRDASDGARQVFVMSALLVTDERPTLDASCLTKAGDDAWLVAESNACMTLFPARDFETVGAPSLVLTPDYPGVITLGQVGADGELESGYRLEITAAPAEDDAVRLSVRFLQSESGARIRTARVVDVVVPKRDSLFLRTRAPGGMPER